MSDPKKLWDPHHAAVNILPKTKGNKAQPGPPTETQPMFRQGCETFWLNRQTINSPQIDSRALLLGKFLGPIAPHLAVNNFFDHWRKSERFECRCLVVP